MNRVLLVLALLLPLYFSQWTNYQADFIITDKPGLSGTLSGRLYYSAQFKSIRYAYTALGYDEISKYDSSSETGYFVYKKCSGCDTIPLDRSIPMPNFYRGGEGCSGTINTAGGQCTVCTKASNDPVRSVCVNSADNRPIQIILRDGTTITLTSTAQASVPQNQIDANLLGWGCVLNCDNVMDIALVVDQSGSISGNYQPPNAPTGEWAQIRNFAIGFTNLFSIAPNKVNMGLVQFGSGAKIVVNMIDNQQQYRNAINGLTKCSYDCSGGATYTGTGIIYGVDILKDQSGARYLRRNVPKIIVLITDGVDTQPNNPFTWSGRSWSNTISASNSWLAHARNQGVKIIAVGVGDDINKGYLDSLASTAADGVTKLSYLATTFDFLSSSSVINQLGNLVCSASGSNNPCPNCAGICACGQCKCPDAGCDDGNACTTGVCNANQNYLGGCLFKPVNCDDGNACTIDTCNTQTGCVNTPVNPATYCDDGDACTIDTCEPSIGCIHTPVDCRNTNSCLINSVCDPANGRCTTPTDICNDNNQCTEDCQAGQGCNFRPIDCTRGNRCILPDCNPATGCLNTSRSCDDGNACTADTCDPATGCQNTPIDCNDNNPCTDDSCDPVQGCLNTPINVDQVCNLGDICSDYTCDPTFPGGCKATPKVCENNFNDSCIITVCDPFQGCLPAPFKCNSTNSDPNCFITYCNHSHTPDKCYEQELESCIIAKLAAGGGGAVLSIGAIVAIIIGAVLCAGGTTVGAYIGFTKAFTGEFEHKSPIYEKETVEGKNPAFGRESVFNAKPVKPV